MHMMPFQNRCPGGRQRGLSIVEFLVGIAVGLFIVGGAVKLFVDNLTNNRRMLVETRVNQDLRAAADLIVRDVRRAGYWRNAEAGVSTDPAVAAVANVYSPVNYNSGAGELTYSYAKDNDNALSSAEGFGVRRGTVGGVGVIQLRTADNWQTITDPGTMEIPSAADLSITASASPVVELWDACPCLFKLVCTAGQFANPNPATGAKGIYFDSRPRLAIRQYTVDMRGRSVADSRVSRRITETVRVRNDEVIGACP